jgi:hypothetical protein
MQRPMPRNVLTSMRAILFDDIFARMAEKETEGSAKAGNLSQQISAPKAGQHGLNFPGLPQ